MTEDRKGIIMQNIGKGIKLKVWRTDNNKTHNL